MAPGDDRMTPRKWCSGPCGRELDRSKFYVNGQGYPNGECKACHRVSERDKAKAPKRLKVRRRRERRLYATDPAWADRKKAGVRASYWARKATA